MSDLFGNHIVGFPTRRLKSLSIAWARFRNGLNKMMVYFNNEKCTLAILIAKFRPVIGDMRCHMSWSVFLNTKNKVQLPQVN